MPEAFSVYMDNQSIDVSCKGNEDARATAVNEDQEGDTIRAISVFRFAEEETVNTTETDKQDVSVAFAVQIDEDDNQTDAEVNFRCPWIALHEAAKNGDVSSLASLLKNGVTVNNRDHKGRTALYCAAKSGNVEMVQLLVQNGATVNDDDDFGQTALHEAVFRGNVEMVQFLLQNGATADHRSNIGWTALHVAASRESIEMVQLLLQNGAAVSDPDYGGRTALHEAASRENTEMVQFLVQNGAAVNGRDDEEWTVLDHAVKSGKTEMVQFLLQNGVTMNDHDNEGWTVLHLAATYGKTEMVQFLLQNGATVNHRNNGGMTALHVAAMYGKTKTVQYLVQNGATVSHCNNRGRTALHEAVSSKSVKMVQFLLQSGATVNDHDNEGWTALHHAAKSGKTKMAQCLVQNGAAVNDHSNIDQNALRYDADEEVTGTEKCLLKIDTHMDTDPRCDNGRFLKYRLSDDQSTEAVCDSMPKKKSTGEWSINQSDVEFDTNEHALEGGIFATVHFGKWMGAPIAVKKMASRNLSSLFHQEMNTWFRLNHPHVVGLYGAWDGGTPSFVCERPSNGTLDSYLKQHDQRRVTWTKLHEVALGLQYLHERGIVHGDLRCGNVLVGGDGVAKLTGFGFSFDSKRIDVSRNTHVFSGLNWRPPECLKGKRPSFASDVYSLGMTVIEAVNGTIPWGERVSASFLRRQIRSKKLPPRPRDFTDSQWALVKRMCSFNPQKRLSMSTVVRELQDFAKQETTDGMSQTHDSTSESCIIVKEYRVRDLNNIPIAIALRRIESFCSQSETVNLMSHQVYTRLADIYDQLQKPDRSPNIALFNSYIEILVRFYSDLQASTSKSPLVNFAVSRQRANNSFIIHGELDRLMQLLGLSKDNAIHQWNDNWKTALQQQMKRFSEQLNRVQVLLRDVSENQLEQAEALTCLRFELSKHRTNYDTIDSTIIEEACTEIETVHGVSMKDWFIPSYEVSFDEVNPFSKGSYGSVHHGTWLNSSVVIKKVLRQEDEDYREIFEREVAIWFGLFHPHVVRLFGACHVGDQPFFVCEFAGNGQLDKYLENHPEQTWLKLYEAALGLQYLHYRKIVHGDLKCNNILIGSDGLAKLTDFGLSLDSKSEKKHDTNSPVGAVRWKAPECLEGKESKERKEPTFASDIYSFGMCIVEAVSGEFPWGNVLIDATVKFHVKQGKLPERPANFEDDQWQLVTQMCKSDPNERLVIDEVVQQLKELADV